MVESPPLHIITVDTISSGAHAWCCDRDAMARWDSSGAPHTKGSCAGCRVQQGAAQEALPEAGGRGKAADHSRALGHAGASCTARAITAAHPSPIEPHRRLRPRPRPRPPLRLGARARVVPRRRGLPGKAGLHVLSPCATFLAGERPSVQDNWILPPCILASIFASTRASTLASPFRVRRSRASSRVAWRAWWRRLSSTPSR